MTLRLDIHWYEYEDYAPIAERFLHENNAWGQIPVPIEDIIDLGLGIDIVPMPGLFEAFDIDAYSSNNFDCITVDEYIYDKVPNRYRFSLAHEVAHRLLHAHLFEPYPFVTIQEYINFQTQVTEKDRGWLEGQANCLAGHILMPNPFFKEAFAAALSELKGSGISLTRYWDEVVSYVVVPLSRRFCVSEQAAEIRISHSRFRERYARGR